MFLCHAVRSTRGDRTLHLEYSLHACSCFLQSGTCTLLPRYAYALTELLLHSIVFFCHTHLTHGCSSLIDCGSKSYLISYPTMQLPSTSWSCNVSQSTLRDMYVCFRQNRLSLTRYSVNHHYHRPCTTVVPDGQPHSGGFGDHSSWTTGEARELILRAGWIFLIVFAIKELNLLASLTFARYGCSRLSVCCACKHYRMRACLSESWTQSFPLRQRNHIPVAILDQHLVLYERKNGRQQQFVGKVWKKKEMFRPFQTNDDAFPGTWAQETKHDASRLDVTRAHPVDLWVTNMNTMCRGSFFPAPQPCTQWHDTEPITCALSIFYTRTKSISGVTLFS